MLKPVKMLRCEVVDRNPNMVADESWTRDASHYKVTLGYSRRRLTTYYSMGSAHTEPPTVNDVLYCLASDAMGYENARSFEDWAGEYGYDTDSRSAERIYRAVERSTANLKRLFGPDFEEALTANWEG